MDNVPALGKCLSTIGELGLLAADIQAQLSNGKGPDPQSVTLPSEFVSCWHHLVIGLLHWNEERPKSSQGHFKRSLEKLSSGYALMLSSFQGKRLQEMRAAMPSDLAVFLVSNLLRDIPLNSPDILAGYEDSLEKIVSIQMTRHC